ncbi:ribose-phosphate pyrophosphokinase [Vibrio astriarenae]|nr:ribose-phosphate pyrophosphokinase [Vibrio sp. C7]
MSSQNGPSNDVVIVSNSSDNPFAIDVAYAMGQHEDISDVISMKHFMNTEFCPRFHFR